MNALDKLMEIQNQSNKNRELAINSLKEIEAILEPFFTEFYSNKSDYPTIPFSVCIHTWNKDKGKFTCNNDLYYFYNPFYTKGFHVLGPEGFDHICCLKGDAFWIRVKDITEWLEKGLILFLERNMKSRDQRVERLQSFIEKLK